MRFLAFFFTAAIAVAPLAVRADDSAAALLAKHRAFVGWASGDAGMGSWSRTERQSVTRGGKTFVTTGVELRQGLVYRENISYDDGTSTQEGFTGRVFWETNINGFAHPVLDDNARSNLDDDVVFDEAQGLIANPILKGQAMVGKTQTSIVHLEPNNGLPMDVYVDPQTGAFKQVIIDPGGRYDTTLTIDEYADAGSGRKVIGAYHWGNGAPWRTTAFKTGVAVTPEDLHPPQPQAAWAFNGSASVPIEYVTHSSFGNAIVVGASINGRPGRFLLDSGAGEIVLNERYTRGLGLRHLGNDAYSGIAGERVSAKRVLIDTLQIGPDVLHHVIATEGPGDSAVDGILGYDVFAGAVVDVNLVSHTLTLQDPSVYTPSLQRGAYAFPVNLQSLQPQIEIALSADAKAHPIFDTGDDFFMVLADRVRDKGVTALGDEIETPYGSTEMRPWFDGVDGSTLASGCVRLNRINVGPYPYERAPLCFSSSRAFGTDGGLIGFDFLRHFNWTFDYPNNQMILTPNGE